MRSIPKITIIIAFLLCNIQLQSQSHPDWAALKALYDSTEGENWFDNTGWAAGVNDPESDPCSGWNGVDCDGGARVIELRLVSNNLKGNLPSELEELTLIERLHFVDNKLSGEIPESLQNLEFLRYFQIGVNNFSGEIPDFFGNWPNLRQLSLYRNSFSGEVPVSIANLTNLTNLELLQNDLSGEIFPILVELKKLNFLNIAWNDFEGEIPSNITDVPNLIAISLEHNNFSGVIPASWADKDIYIFFKLNHNNFSGCIDPDFYKFCGDDKVDISNNPMLPWQGDLDEFCATTGSMQGQYGAPCILDNSTGGQINEDCECAASCDHPDFEGLMALYANTFGSSWDNRDGWKEGFNGEDCDPCSWYGVECNGNNRVISLGLSDNNLKGSLPEEISKVTELEQLGLSSNSIWGNIPNGLYDLIKLKGLNISGNSFTGELSEKLGLLTKLESLAFHNNNLSGSIPNTIEALIRVTSLTGYTNEFTGDFPVGIANLTDLTTLNLERNQLSGPLPENIGDLTLLNNLRLQNNNLSGQLPSSLGDLENLSILYLQNNEFSGCIDENLHKLCNIGIFDISNNVGLSWNGDTEMFCASSGLSEEQQGTYCGLGGSGIIDSCECIESNNLCFVPEGILCKPWVQELVNTTDCYDFGFGQRSIFSLSVSSFGDIPVLVMNQGSELASKVISTVSVYTCEGELLEVCSYGLGTSCGDSMTIHSQLEPKPTQFYHCMNDELPDCNISIQHPDYNALSDLYYGTEGLKWQNQDGWKEGIQDPFSNPCEEWYGVTCDEDGRVDSINLHFNKLRGTLPNSIGDLENLTYLDISWNPIEGSIPESIGNLKMLNYLDASLCSFNLPINESFGGLTNLAYLNLELNKIIGPLPESLGNLKKLKYFNFDNNFIESIHSTIGNMESLEFFSGIANEIQDTLPDNIGNLSQLDTLDLILNQIEGVIPNSIINLNNLKRLALTHNKLQGEIPTEIGLMSKLKYLSFGDNNLQGNIPESILDLKELQVIHLGNNNFTGEVPSNITNLNSLKTFILRENNFTGPLPDAFSDASIIEFFELYGNDFSGCIPEVYSEFCDDVIFDLSDNPLLPWKGNIDDFCSTNAIQVGAPCDDGDDTNGEDVIKEDCTCGSKPVSTQDIFSEVNVHPIPTQNNLFVEGRGADNWSYEIVDLFGQSVQKSIVKNGQPIALDRLINGIYLLKLYDAKIDKYQTFKIIKN